MQRRVNSHHSDPLLELWLRFRGTNDERERNLLLENYMYLVRYTAQELGRNLPEEVDLDDLVSGGVCGLIDAINAFDPARGVSFESYSEPRIRGAMLDELRAMDWLPRLVRDRLRRLRSARRSAAARLGRPPTDAELAAELRVPEAELRKLQRDARAAGLVSLNEKWFEVRDKGSFDSEGLEAELPEARLVDANAVDPADALARSDLRHALLRGLSRAERMVVLLYYFEDMTMKQIAQALGLPEKRVRRMHRMALQRVKSFLLRHQDLIPGAAIRVSEEPEDKASNLPVVSEVVDATSVRKPIPENPVVEIFMEPGEATSEDLAQLLGALNNLYTALGGAGLRIWGGSSALAPTAEAWV